MVIYQDYYKKLNNKIFREYNDTINKIEKIYIETDKYRGNRNKKDFARFFNKTAKFILKICKFEKNLTEDYFEGKSFDTLLSENHTLFEDVNSKKYNKSYANPAYAVNIFGENIGQLFSYLYVKIREYVDFAYKHKLFEIYEVNKIFINTYEYIFNNKIDVQKLKQIIIVDAKEMLDRKIEIFYRERFSIEMSYIVDFITTVDLSDLRYLFRFGKYITDNEIKTAEFLLKQPKEKIDEIARTYTEGFRKGFIRDDKDMSVKSNVSIRYHIGQELIIKKAIEYFEDMGLNTVITDTYSTEPNKQYQYDHRFDNALYFDEEYMSIKENAMDTIGEKMIDIIKVYAGPAVIETFGEKPFKPKTKKECLKLDEKQSKLFTLHRANLDAIISKYLPREEYSFTIIAFPIPDIGEKFEEIFEETCKVNTLDSDKYEKIQQHIIDVLDKAEYVHVKGKDSNKTDIIVKLHELKNPDKETNFVNCVADVNIPVGEVFTSPVLKGTNGVLHVKEVYLGDLKYENLILTFKDGYIDEYSCTNFDSEEENKKYIEENLMFPHKTLPLGEFAIGTNTTAYAMANKYDIVNILPILIVEKMGPHFAVGDTCFSWSEDKPVYNPLDKKEVIARDNERTILRKEDVKKAYTQVHTDITLPYDGLELISAVKPDGERINIIKDGKFVIEGTEELNKPL